VTTKRFNEHAGAYAQALNAIKSVHCQPPAYAPPAEVKGHIPCTKCKERLNFTVFASGSTTGRCTTTGCLNWRE
jgi:hypothetical protein